MPDSPVLTMSVRIADITPHSPPWTSLWMGGYGWGRRGNHGLVARPLFAHCAVIETGGVPQVLLRVDTVSVPRDIHQALRDRLVNEGVVARDNFLMSISHTHSGPFIGDTQPEPFVMMGLDPADIDAINGSSWLFQDALFELVKETVAAPRVPVTLGFASGSTDIGFNRIGLDTVLTDVPVLLARRVSNGQPFAVLFGYACHAVARGGDDQFDSDYCGVAAQLITDRLGIPALFFQGAAGDHDPVGGRGEFAVQDLGHQLADAVIDVIAGRTFAPVTGPVTSSMVEVELPFAVDLDDPIVRAELDAKYQQRVNAFPAESMVNRHATVMLRKLRAGELPSSIAMPIQRLRLGGLVIMALGHEVLSMYDVEIKAMTDGPVWVMGYANEIGCYVPGDEILWAGAAKHNGYEAGWTDDPRITGIGTSMMAFAWPAPLRSSPVGTTPAAEGSVQRIVLDACRELLLDEPVDHVPGDLQRTGRGR